MGNIYLSRKIRISAFVPPALFLMLVLEGYRSVILCVIAVALHEAAHIISGTFCKKRVSGIDIGLLGADITYVGQISYAEDIFISLSGPAASIAAGLLTLPLFPCFANTSLIYGILNLFPVNSLDGGRILKAALFFGCEYTRAGKISAAVSLCFLFILYLAGVFVLLYTSANASLFMICVYVFFRSFKSELSG